MLHPYFFMIDIMRIFISIIISCLVHFFVLSSSFLMFDVVHNTSEHDSLSVSFARKSLENTSTDNKNLVKPIKTETTNNQKRVRPSQKTISQSITSPMQDASLNAEDSVKNLVDYFSATEVDRKAIPQMNIDQSMLSTEGYSGLSVRFRLYINAFGRVVKVEPVAVLDQDAPFAEKLASLLYSVRFLPAKRDGLDVDSYQDLLLSFNPQPIPGVD